MPRAFIAIKLFLFKFFNPLIDSSELFFKPA